MSKKNKPMPGTRSLMLLDMLLTRKGGQHRDQKAHAKRQACRGKVQED